jgi:chondroitin AC lyase
MEKSLFRFAMTAFAIVVLGINLSELSSYSQVSVVTDRLKNDLISQNINDADITGLLSSLKTNGSWDDIDYANRSRTTWSPSTHSRRLLQICRVYNKPGSIHFHNADVKSKILKIIDFCIAYKPVSDNWWYNAIGVPISSGPAVTNIH